MTAYPSARQVLGAALSQVGVTESPAGSNLTPYGKAYGWNGVAWCGIFVWWAFAHAGIDLRKGGVLNPQFTPWFFEEAKKAGWVVEPDASIRAGDVLFFDFEPPFNTAGIQHVGLATETPSGGYVKTVEGNTSSGSVGSQDNGGGVFRRTRSLDWVVAVVRPPYSPDTPPVTIHGPASLGDDDHSTHGSVSPIQRRINRLQGTHLVIDGNYGPLTKAAVAHWQAHHRLSSDGIVGPLTARALGFIYDGGKK
jgi:hypothetical protein